MRTTITNHVVHINYTYYKDFLLTIKHMYLRPLVFFYMIILLLISAVAGLPCSPGTYTINPTSPCQNCSAGFFQNSSGATNCKGCSIGHYQNEVAQSECKVCPMGYFQNTNTEENCKQCSAGTYASTTGLASCEQCPSGTYSSEIAAVGSHVCQDCPENTHDISFRSRCDLCEVGFTSPSRASSCTECPSSGSCCAGYGSEGSGCQLCLAGNFSNNGICELCPSGYISYQNRTNPTTGDQFFLYATDGANECQQCQVGSSPSQTGCRECPTGKYENNRLCIDCEAGKFRANASDLSCSSCPVGFITNTSGQVECEPCDYNHLSNGSTHCSPCPTARFSPKGSVECNESCDAFDNVFNDTAKCTYCPPGTFSDNSSLTSVSQCQICPIGYIRPYEYDNLCIPCQNSVSNSNRTTCNDCPLGQEYYNLNCQDCSAGTFRDNTSDICQDCSTGLYQSEVGQAFCQQCEIGRYSVAASTSCTDCPEGYISTSNGTENCLQCPNGKGTKNSTTECSNCTFGEETFNGQCVLCPAGKEATAVSVCSSCPYGQVTQTQNTSCGECASATYAKNASFCGACDGPNKYTNKIGNGSTHCIECLPNTTTLCQDCDSGKYNENGTCQQCPAGWVNKAQRYCQQCSPTSVPNTAATECEHCQDGKQKEGVSCQDCALGQFGQFGICHECLLGKYQTQSGKLSCIDCATAELKTTANKGSKNTTDCVTCESLGYLSTTVVLQGTCSACQTGRFVSGQKNSCENCPSGYYRSATETVCSICPIGQFSETGDQGTGSCTNCVSGKYTSEEGQASCKQCSDTSGHLCDDCSAGKKQVGNTCVNCQPGKFSVSAQTTCQTCSIGLYQDEQAGTFCKGCPSGEYQNEESKSVCKKCLVGYFQPIDRQGACHKCVVGRYADEQGLSACQLCPDGHYTDSIASTSSSECKACPKGYFELQGSCSTCPESNYQDVEAQKNCKTCPQGEISSVAATNVSDCFSIAGITSYVFGMKSDAKQVQRHAKTCEIRPNLMLLCPGCSCDSDSRNGFWAGPLCDECQRGFATRTCTVGCPTYDGTHDSTMCNGKGKCWFGKYGNGLCYCGGLSVLDSTAENAVVDVRLCPKGTTCPNYGDEEQEETSYRSIYYIMLYREYSVFVLQLNRYTPESGHMWFERYARNKAYENTCSACVSAFQDTIQTKIGYWSKEQDWKYFKDSLQVENGFHGENCQHECGLCMNGGKCHAVPHPYRYTYTIKDTFQPQKSVSLPTTTCACSSISFDSSNMCCPNGFQPYIFYGVRGSEPYTRFTRMPFITSLVNVQRDYWINKDIYLEPGFTIPYAEPDSGEITVMQQDKAVVRTFVDTGPYNKHVFYGVPKDICRACPGLFGMGVRSQGQLITSEPKAEEFWWDNAMGAMSRKCNGIGVCDFYKKEREQDVHFMGNAQAYNMVTQNKVCNTPAVFHDNSNNIIDTIEKCATYASGHGWFSFSNSYRGGTASDFSSETYATVPPTHHLGYGSYLDGTERRWVVLNTTEFPMPDPHSKYTITASDTKCAKFDTCESYTVYPGLSTYKMEVGRGDSRLSIATFNRFDTCFTFTYEDKISVFGLYVTKDYTQGQDPFLGGLCPKGYFCTTYNDVGYKEACPPGYYQEFQGVTRTVASVQCSKQTTETTGCTSLKSTRRADDYVDKVCKRCSRNAWSSAGSAACTECPRGRVKKISGVFEVDTPMLNFPTSLSEDRIWYYQDNEQGYQESDCALVPEAIIHIPDMNSHMTYDKPAFLPVVSCPYGYSSRAGSYTNELSTDLLTIMESKMAPEIVSVIDAPYIKLNDEQDDQPQVWRNFVISNCFRCPGNSISGPESGACVTCYANQMKWYAKIALQQAAEQNMQTFQQYKYPDHIVQNLTKIQNIVLSQKKTFDIIYGVALVPIDNTEVDLNNCYLQCQFKVTNLKIIGVRQKLPHANGAYDGPLCYCATSGTEGSHDSSLSDGTIWYETSGVPEDWSSGAMPLCFACQPGNYKQGGQCKMCETGYYTETPLQANRAMCQQCVPGTYQNTRGQTSCKNCDAGKSQHQHSQAMCLPCATGKYQSDVGTSECLECLPGQFQDDTGKISCKDCQTGQFRAERGQTGCGNCVAGQYQDELGKIGCKSCAHGTSANDVGRQGVCTPCDKGKFQSGVGQKSCDRCSKGMYMDEQGSSGNCKNCDGGAGNQSYANTDGARACTICPGGQKCDRLTGPGQTCEKGEYVAPGYYAKTCTECEENEGSNPDKTDCEPCASGSYATKGSGCQTCPEQGFDGHDDGAGWDTFGKTCDGDCEKGVVVEFEAHWIAQTTGKRMLWIKQRDDKVTLTLTIDGQSQIKKSAKCCESNPVYKVFDLKKGQTGTMTATCENNDARHWSCRFGIYHAVKVPPSPGVPLPPWFPPVYERGSGNGMHFFEDKPPSKC